MALAIDRNWPRVLFRAALCLPALAGACSMPTRPSAPAAVSAEAGADAASCRAVPSGAVFPTSQGGVAHVRSLGEGRPVMMIPSLGRGSSDFDDVATRLAARGFFVILPEPRGIGSSQGGAPRDLFDLASDAADVLKALCSGPVDIVGHAFGNRVARALATSHPARVRRLILLAGGGEMKPSAAMVAALRGSTMQGTKPDAERLKDLQTAFFAPGNDASVWLKGWYPAVASTQARLAQNTPSQTWWKGGTSDILLVQAAEDPIAPPGNGAVLKADIGPRLTIVILPNASHAILPEQPQAVAAVIADYLTADKPDERAIQSVIDQLAQ